MGKPRKAEVIIVGGGLAGLSAAIYLGRARRNTLLVDGGKSMARWEPEVQNYLGFEKGIAGPKLLEQGRRQVGRYGLPLIHDCIVEVRAQERSFTLRGNRGWYACQRLLLATGSFHIPPDIPGVEPCLGHSLFFCKDCDGYRVRGRRVVIYGWSNEAVDYALGMLLYSPRVMIVTDGRKPRWDAQHTAWIRQYHFPVYLASITNVRRDGRSILALEFLNGEKVLASAMFTTRGDIYYNGLAKTLGAKLNAAGEIAVDVDMRTSVPRLYAAGCVTPANCQMIIAAGQGAAAAQTINRDMLAESLATHSLRRFRARQLRRKQVRARSGGD